MKGKLAALVVVGMLLTAMTALGHHSFAGTYDLDQHKTIQGTVTSFTVRNPHSYLTIEVKDPDGKVQVWGVEWAGTTVLRDSGVTQTTLKFGDKVIITGAPPKGNEAKLLMQRVVRSVDQWTWQGQVGRFKSSNTPLPPVETQ
jgi:Family of unknown function (DUF6152)